MPLYELPEDKVTRALRGAAAYLDAMSAEDRVKLLISSGAIPPEHEAQAVERLKAADERKRKAAARKAKKSA